MEWGDNHQHHKPHIHVAYNEFKVSIALDGEILNTGKKGFPNKILKLVAAWIILHEEELYSMWIKAVKGEEIGKIPPLC
jgi:hypothetical protein